MVKIGLSCVLGILEGETLSSSAHSESGCRTFAHCLHRFLQVPIVSRSTRPTTTGETAPTGTLGGTLLTRRYSSFSRSDGGHPFHFACESIIAAKIPVFLINSTIVQ
jgi:hypothetical protein